MKMTLLLLVVSFVAVGATAKTQMAGRAIPAMSAPAPVPQWVKESFLKVRARSTNPYGALLRRDTHKETFPGLRIVFQKPYKETILISRTGVKDWPYKAKMSIRIAREQMTIFTDVDPPAHFGTAAQPWYSVSVIWFGNVGARKWVRQNDGSTPFAQTRSKEGLARFIRWNETLAGHRVAFVKCGPLESLYIPKGGMGAINSEKSVTFYYRQAIVKTPTSPNHFESWKLSYQWMPDSTWSLDTSHSSIIHDADLTIRPRGSPFSIIPER